MFDRRWNFVLSCIALVTSAFTFVIRGDIFQPLAAAYGLSQTSVGGLGGYVFGGMAISMLVGGLIADVIGVKRVMVIAFLCHLVGSAGFIFAPSIVPMLIPGDLSAQQTADFAFSYLCVVNFLMGCGNGMTEVGINPLVATMFPKEKTHYLNILHAWWPGGLVIGAFGTVGVGMAYPGYIEPLGLGLAGWQVSLLLILLPTLVYGAMLIPAKFPPLERTAAGVSWGAAFLQLVRPLFLIWAVCMLLTAATELGVQAWQESVLSATANMSGTMIVAYTAGMMFVLRHFAGAIVHRISPVGLLWFSSILSAAGLAWLSMASTPTTVIAAATVFGLGIAFYWPTMLGVTAERFPKGGALTLSLMGSVGNLSIAFVTPLLGTIADHYQVQYVKEQAPILAPVLLQADPPESENFVSLNVSRLDALKEAVKEEKAFSTGEGTEPLPTLEATTEAAEVGSRAKAFGFSWAFLWTSVLPCVLIVLFGGVWIYDAMRGGYKPEVLITREEEDELFAGGAQGPIS
jgi:MFS family permease